MAWVQLDSYFCFKRHQTRRGGRKTEQGHGVHSQQVGKKTVPYQLSFKITMPCTERWLQLDERQHQQRYTRSYGWTEYLQEVYIRHKASDLLTLGPPFAPVNMESISSIYPSGRFQPSSLSPQHFSLLYALTFWFLLLFFKENFIKNKEHWGMWLLWFQAT